MTTTIKVGWDYDEPIHPWMYLAHKTTIDAGLIPADHPMPNVWDAAKHYGIDPEVWYKAIDAEVLKGVDGSYLAPLDEAVKWELHRLADAGFENHVVTARGHFGNLGHVIRDLTEQHIDREGLPVTSLHFALDKVKTVNELGLDYFIDDGAHNYEAIAEGCPDTAVYLLDRPWNRSLRVPPARRLYTITEYVDRILANHAVTVGV